MLGRKDIYRGDSFLPRKRFVGVVRFHHGGRWNETFGDGEVVNDGTRMGLESGGGGVHIHHAGGLSISDAERLLKERDLIPEDAHVTQVMSPRGRKNAGLSKDGHFIRVTTTKSREEDHHAQRVDHFSGWRDGSFYIWGVKIDM